MLRNAASRIVTWIAAGVVCSLPAAQMVQACAFHGYTPNPTLVDVLLATEQVSVARPAQGNRNSYALVDTLVGPDVSDIPIPVGPDVRRRLRDRPQAAVLLARDGAYGPWVEIAVMDARFQRMIDEVLLRQSAWQLGADQERLAFFAGRVNDPSADVRELALRELDRASYSQLRRLRLPAMQGLGQQLETGDPSLLPIRVLLAGLSGDRGFSPQIAAGLGKAIRKGAPYLGAYATALIELEGQAAVAQIIEGQLRPGKLPPVTNERLLEALALQQKTAAASLRNAISRDVAALVRDMPQLGDAAARQFGGANRWRPSSPAASSDR